MRDRPSEVPLSISTVAAAVATERRRRWRRVEGTGDRVCGDRFRVWWSAAASLRLSFVTRQPYSVYWYARRRHPRTSPPSDSCLVVQLSDRDFVTYFTSLFSGRRPVSRTRSTVVLITRLILYWALLSKYLSMVIIIIIISPSVGWYTRFRRQVKYYYTCECGISYLPCTLHDLFPAMGSQ